MATFPTSGGVSHCFSNQIVHSPHNMTTFLASKRSLCYQIFTFSTTSHYTRGLYNTTQTCFSQPCSYMPLEIGKPRTEWMQGLLQTHADRADLNCHCSKKKSLCWTRNCKTRYSVIIDKLRTLGELIFFLLQMLHR